MLHSRAAYTGCMVIAILVASWFLSRAKHLQTSPLSSLEKLGLGMGAMMGATLAAKLPFLYSGALQHGVLGTWFADGKTILWALAGGYAGVELAKWTFMIQIRTGDTFVVPVAVAIAIGRVGCLAYGCCYGEVTQSGWGLSFVAAPDEGTLLRHPTQLYELIFHLVFAWTAWRGIQRRVLPTQWMLIYLISYCVFRFLTEFIRPEPVMMIGLTFYQVSCLGFGGVFAGLWFKRATQPLSPPS